MLELSDQIGAYEVARGLHVASSVPLGTLGNLSRRDPRGVLPHLADIFDEANPQASEFWRQCLPEHGLPVGGEVVYEARITPPGVVFVDGVRSTYPLSEPIDLLNTTIARPPLWHPDSGMPYPAWWSNRRSHPLSQSLVVRSVEIGSAASSEEPLPQAYPIHLVEGIDGQAVEVLRRYFAEHQRFDSRRIPALWLGALSLRAARNLLAEQTELATQGAEQNIRALSVLRTMYEAGLRTLKTRKPH